MQKEGKKTFKLFDFFANVEYFEEKYDYDEILKLPPLGEGIGDGPGGEGVEVTVNGITIAIPDPEKTTVETPIGIEGMKVDWKFFEKFEQTVKNDTFIKAKFEDGDINAVEEYIKSNIFNKPIEHYDLQKLRKSVKADRRLSLREIIEKIFGRISNFKSKDELLEEEFEKFISIYKPKSEDIPLIKNYLKAYITDNDIRDIIETGDFTRLATNSKLNLVELKQLKQSGYITVIPEYVKDYVVINSFM
jgi:type I restriction enzyme R subunit